MELSSKSEVLAYMRQARYAVIATVDPDGQPESALMGIATTNELEVVFDTLSTSRKHMNLLRNNHIAVTFSGPDEQTLQLEGIAIPVPVTGSAGYEYRETYYAVWPAGRERTSTPQLAYWRVAPRWARHSDYAGGPLVVEFRWDEE
jgi:pyridoxine/pyridoxamine 5'-phosphate oxidase